jgi:hypothetical protein
MHSTLRQVAYSVLALLSIVSSATALNAGTVTIAPHSRGSINIISAQNGAIIEKASGLYTFPDGCELHIVASPNYPATFTGWKESTETSALLRIIVEGNKLVTPQFLPVVNNPKKTVHFEPQWNENLVVGIDGYTVVGTNAMGTAGCGWDEAFMSHRSFAGSQIAGVTARGFYNGCNSAAFAFKHGRFTGWGYDGDLYWANLQFRTRIFAPPAAATTSIDNQFYVRDGYSNSGTSVVNPYKASGSAVKAVSYVDLASPERPTRLRLTTDGSLSFTKGNPGQFPWSTCSINSFGPFKDISAGFRFFAAISSNTLFTSKDGIEWEASVPLVSNTQLKRVRVSRFGKVAWMLCENGTVIVYENGSQWGQFGESGMFSDVANRSGTAGDIESFDLHLLSSTGAPVLPSVPVGSLTLETADIELDGARRVFKGLIHYSGQGFGDGRLHLFTASGSRFIEHTNVEFRAVGGTPGTAIVSIELGATVPGSGTLHAQLSKAVNYIELGASSHALVRLGSAVPAITTPPISQAATVGQQVIFSVLADGSTPLSYQWRKGDADIPGATGSTYVIPAVVLTNSDGYTVVVRNASGAVTNDPPAILLVHPANTRGGSDEFSTPSISSSRWGPPITDGLGAGGFSTKVAVLQREVSGRLYWTSEAPGNRDGFSFCRIPWIPDSPTQDADWLVGVDVEIAEGSVLSLETGDLLAAAVVLDIFSKSGEILYNISSEISINNLGSRDFNQWGSVVFGANTSSFTNTGLQTGRVFLEYTAFSKSLRSYVVADGEFIELGRLSFSEFGFRSDAKLMLGLYVYSYNETGSTSTGIHAPASAAVEGKWVSFDNFVYQTSEPFAKPVAILKSPVSQSVAAGEKVSFFAEASEATNYRWQFMSPGDTNWITLANDGVFSGVTTPTLTVVSSTLLMNGISFRCIASNSAGSVASNLAVLSVTDPDAPVLGTPNLYVGFLVRGKVGKAYRIETAQQGSGAWTDIGGLTLTNASQLWLDTASPVEFSTRLYRAVKP